MLTSLKLALFTPLAALSIAATSAGRLARAEGRGDGLSLERAGGAEGPSHQPGACLPEGAHPFDSGPISWRTYRPSCPRPRPSTGVTRGLDPRVHPLRRTFCEEDGLPGQARQ
jgi:hypothetical protein